MINQKATELLHDIIEGRIHLELSEDDARRLIRIDEDLDENRAGRYPTDREYAICDLIFLRYLLDDAYNQIVRLKVKPMDHAENNALTALLIMETGRKLGDVESFGEKVVCLEGVTAGLIMFIADLHNKPVDILVDAFCDGLRRRVIPS